MTYENMGVIISEEYVDLIIDYRGNPLALERFAADTVQIMNEAFAIAYLPITRYTARAVWEYGYAPIPSLFGLVSEAALRASGVYTMRGMPGFNLRGNGVLVGVIDTGIDYTNPAFRWADGTTKIVSLWDQTIPSVDRFPGTSFYGTEYSREEINAALQTANPLELVPSMDVNGHGTMLAGIAAGTEMPAQNFFGVAPDAELVVVKLKEAKQGVRNFFFIPEGVSCYQENDIMWGVQHCIQAARRVRRPLVICIGVGTAMESHDGNSPLAQLLSIVADFSNTAVVTAVGNEGNMGRHYYGVVDPATGYNTVELNAGAEDRAFSMEIWGDAPGIYSIDILSPSGEYIPRIPASIRVNREITFIFEDTVIYIDYLMVESQTGDQLILMRFNNITPGLWRINVYGRSDLPASFHIWLPMGDFISPQTFFIQPNIFTTLLSPGTSFVPITVTAYNPLNENLFLNASRGFTRGNVVKPELAAPGVNYIAPGLGGEWLAYTGTGVAAAHTAGIVALILEWGAVRGNLPGIDSLVIKNFLIRGARRRTNITYPNRDWGYGILDVFNMFDILRAEI